jgi:hypothetical protein
MEGFLGGRGHAIILPHLALVLEVHVVAIRTRAVA